MTKKFLKHTKSSHVWHYPNIEKLHRYSASISVSICGVVYRNTKQSVSWPVCKQCLSLDGFAYSAKVVVKLPKTIREQSFEPPEAHS